MKPDFNFIGTDLLYDSYHRLFEIQIKQFPPAKRSIMIENDRPVRLLKFRQISLPWHLFIYIKVHYRDSALEDIHGGHIICTERKIIDPLERVNISLIRSLNIFDEGICFGHEFIDSLDRLVYQFWNTTFSTDIYLEKCEYLEGRSLMNWCQYCVKRNYGYRESLRILKCQ